MTRASVLVALGLGVLLPRACFAGPEFGSVAPIEGSAAERQDDSTEHTHGELYGGLSGRQADCAYIIVSWETGETQEIVGRYGDRAAEVVEVCRLILGSSDP